MKNLLIALLCLPLLYGCVSIRTDADGTPDKKGKYETKKFAGITYSRKEIPTRSERIDKIVTTFFLVCGGLGAIGLIVSGVLFFKRIGVWDEVLCGSACALVIAIAGIFLFPIFKWIVPIVVVIGLMAFLAYEIRKRALLTREVPQT